MRNVTFHPVRAVLAIALICLYPLPGSFSQPPPTSGQDVNATVDANGNLKPSTRNGHPLNLPSGTTLNGSAIGGGSGLSGGTSGHVITASGATTIADSGVALTDVARKSLSLSQFTSTTSANLAGVLSDEVGSSNSGKAVFGNGPAIYDSGGVHLSADFNARKLYLWNSNTSTLQTAMDWSGTADGASPMDGDILFYNNVQFRPNTSNDLGLYVNQEVISTLNGAGDVIWQGDSNGLAAMRLYSLHNSSVVSVVLDLENRTIKGSNGTTTIIDLSSQDPVGPAFPQGIISPTVFSPDSNVNSVTIGTNYVEVHPALTEDGGSDGYFKLWNTAGVYSRLFPANLTANRDFQFANAAGTLAITTNSSGVVDPTHGGTGLTSLGTGVGTALGINVGSAGAFVTNGGALGTPSSGTLTNATGLPITGITSSTSAQLRTLLSDENGTGVAIFDSATNPTFDGATINNGSLTISGNISSAAWTTSGLRLKGIAGTLTDTTSSGTVAAAYTNKLGGNTIAASSATTFTNYISGYFSDPVAGTNVTITNKYALGADSLIVGTSTPLTISTSGVLTATSPVLTTPNLGTPSALVGTNITGTATAFNINGTVGATTPAAGTFTTLTDNGNLTFGTSASILNGATGSIGITATGTNQSITLTPSGTGSIICGRDGLVATPAIRGSDTDSGIWFSGNNTRFSVDGQNAMQTAGGGIPVRIQSGGYGITNSTDASGTVEVCYGRNTTSVGEVTNGTTGQWVPLKLGNRDSGTTTVTNGLTVGHQSTGTPAAGLGSGILFNIDSTTTADQNAGKIYAAWTTATHASRTSKLALQVVNNAGALTDALTLNGDTSATFAAGVTVTGASTLTGAVTIGGGTAITKVLSATATLDFGSTLAGGSTDLTITVTGAALGDTVSIGVPNGSVPAGGAFFGWVSATNTVSIRYADNSLVTTYDPASGTFRATVTQF